MLGVVGIALLQTMSVLSRIVLQIPLIVLFRCRLGESVAKVEDAAARALDHRRCAPTLGGMPARSNSNQARAVHCDTIVYVQRVDVAALQAYCEQADARVQVAALPGAFVAPGRPLALVFSDKDEPLRGEIDAVVQAFVLGDDRLFDEDPRFGLIV